MNNNLENYKKELDKEVHNFFKKVDELPGDNPNKESEWKFTRETSIKLNEELKEIYIRLQKKYNIKPDNTEN